MTDDNKPPRYQCCPHCEAPCPKDGHTRPCAVESCTFGRSKSLAR